MGPRRKGARRGKANKGKKEGARARYGGIPRAITRCCDCRGVPENHPGLGIELGKVRAKMCEGINATTRQRAGQQELSEKKEEGAKEEWECTRATCVAVARLRHGPQRHLLGPLQGGRVEGVQIAEDAPTIPSPESRCPQRQQSRAHVQTQSNKLTRSARHKQYALREGRAENRPIESQSHGNRKCAKTCAICLVHVERSSENVHRSLLKPPVSPPPNKNSILPIRTTAPPRLGDGWTPSILSFVHVSVAISYFGIAAEAGEAAKSRTRRGSSSSLCTMVPSSL